MIGEESFTVDFFGSTLILLFLEYFSLFQSFRLLFPLEKEFSKNVVKVNK